MNNEEINSISKELGKFCLFNEVAEHTIKEVAKISIKRKFFPKEYVCIENHDSASLFLIDDGKVEISKKGIPLAILANGDIFGEMSLIGESSTRSATVTTKGESTLFEIPFDTFKPIMSASTEILTNLILIYDKRLRSENQVVINQYKELQAKFQQLQETNEQLLQTEKMASIGTLTASVAHEVNNPLAVILGHLSLQEIKIKKGKFVTEDAISGIDPMKKAAEAIRKIVIGLKTYVRIDSGEDTIINLNDAVTGSLDLVSFLYKKNNITLDMQLCPNNLPIKANIGKIQQVILNLLSNARDAMENSSEKKITIITKQDTNHYILAVKDTGEGIPKEKHELIFKKFYTSKPSGQGTGLGLYIISSIVQGYGGTIKLESELGSGTTFIICFPHST